MLGLKVWISCLLASAGGVLLSYFWIDRPLSLFAHDSTRMFAAFDAATHLPEWLPGICAVVFLIFGIYALGTTALPRHGNALALSSISLMVARAIKDQAKYIFGRTWPETWTHDNASFIHNGVYGFHPFHAGVGFESFPSGHMTATAAVAFILWHFYPRLRMLLLALVALVAVGLLGANYHFLSDVIAGTFLGLSTAMMILAIARALAPDLTRR